MSVVANHQDPDSLSVDTTRVAHLVLTGGPSAGKTSALSFLDSELTARGWRVLRVPEAATTLISAGLHDIGRIATDDPELFETIQVQLVGLQLNLYSMFDNTAHALVKSGHHKVVVIHDRGVCDNHAYIDTSAFARVLEAHQLTLPAAHGLYDGVIHLRSAAVANETYAGTGYTRENNQARYENAAQAADLDERTLRAWRTHPHLSVISSVDSFPDKLQRTLHAVLATLGEPAPREIERKFLLLQAPDLTRPELADADRVDITQTYLLAPHGEQRVRRRVLAGVATYTHTTKVETSTGTNDVGAERLEIERSIDALTWELMCQLRSPGTVDITKTRWIFTHRDHRFELDQFHCPVTDWVLEVELGHPDEEVLLPEWLGPVCEVTTDPRWRNAALAGALEHSRDASASI